MFEKIKEWIKEAVLVVWLISGVFVIFFTIFIFHPDSYQNQQILKRILQTEQRLNCTVKTGTPNDAKCVLIEQAIDLILREQVEIKKILDRLPPTK